MTENEIATLVLDIAFKIHRKYSPGLFESVYEEVFCYELSKKRSFLYKAAGNFANARGSKTGSRL